MEIDSQELPLRGGCLSCGPLSLRLSVRSREAAAVRRGPQPCLGALQDWVPSSAALGRTSASAGSSGQEDGQGVEVALQRPSHMQLGTGSILQVYIQLNGKQVRLMESLTRMQLAK